MDKLHVIHSRNGRIGGRTDTAPADVDAIVAALQADSRKHLVIHFHGGLVSKDTGLEIANRLLPIYSPSTTTGGYPLFFVWESGAWETIRNNLSELADEPVFAQLLRKLCQYALEKVGGEALPGARSVAPASTGELKQPVKEEFERFWKKPGPDTIPFRNVRPPEGGAASRGAAEIDENEIAADLENDRELQQALATLPDVPPASRSAMTGGIAIAEHRSAFSELAALEFSETPGSRGIVAVWRVAKLVYKVLRAILKRYAAGRHHGLYATCVEELVRTFKIAGSGVNEWGKALQWNRMKQDTIDAFGPDPDTHAGTALLARLKRALDAGANIERITLVGHSTGAIYIANWLERSRDFLPQTVSQDVVYLAPAITYDRFAEMLDNCEARIRRFRMFAMEDALELADQVWGSDDELKSGGQDWRRFVYPSSLLYLVSGILESRLVNGQWVDEADLPLVGMQRFFLKQDVYTAAGFPSVGRVRDWLGRAPHRCVWSKTAIGAGAGLTCGSFDHGAFDNDANTLASLTSLVTTA